MAHFSNKQTNKQRKDSDMMKEGCHGWT